MDKEKAEEIVEMYGIISESNCIAVLQSNGRVWNNPAFWDACNYLLQNYDYGFQVV